ncbi:MAG: hypothetical protein JEZ14_17620 [Marinilabiliaceae bacterium]|nr:hypothetical protein [Marinilabiliaceae bacterium]
MKELDNYNVRSLTDTELKEHQGGLVGLIIAGIALALTATTGVGYAVGRLTRD